jgi:hypothetical protein
MIIFTLEIKMVYKLLYNYYISPRENKYASVSYVCFIRKDTTEELHRFLRKHKEIVKDEVSYGVVQYRVDKKPSMDSIIDQKFNYF